MGEPGGASAQVVSARNFNSLKNLRLKFACVFRPANLRNFENRADASNMMRHHQPRCRVMELDNTDDLLDGGDAIAEYLRELGLKANTREVYHLHAKRRLPIGALGRKLVASRTQIRRAVRALTAS